MSQWSLILFFLIYKFRYDTLQKAKNKSADQSALMRKLVCPCCLQTQKTGFLKPTHLSLAIFNLKWSHNKYKLTQYINCKIFIDMLSFQYSRTSMAQKGLGPRKQVLAKGSSSHPGWILHKMTRRDNDNSSSQPR